MSANSFCCGDVEVNNVVQAFSASPLLWVIAFVLKKGNVNFLRIILASKTCKYHTIVFAEDLIVFGIKIIP